MSRGVAPPAIGGPPCGAGALDELVAIAAAGDADVVAVRDAAGEARYGDLDAAAGNVAAALAASGVRRGDAVMVRAAASASYVAAMLGVSRAGAFFLPVDPALPQARRDEMQRRCAARATVLEDGSVVACGDGALGPQEARGGPREQDVAYGLFTSGSTGVPKCALVEQRNILALIDGIDAVAPLRGPVVGMAICPFGFDVSMWEIFGVLRHGGTIVMAGRDAAALDGRLLAATLREQRVTSAYIPPGQLLDVVEGFEAAGDAGDLRRVLVGVEPIAQGVLQRLRDIAPQLWIVNGYGPTETTVCATLFAFDQATDPAARTPIGTAVPGYGVALVDRELRPVAPGTIGEIVVGGAGVGRGYAGEPRLTRERFLDNHLPGMPGERIYRTGDLAVCDREGVLTFAGRRDGQAKIRGFRVELGEVEAALSACPGVRRAIARVAEQAGASRLVAFVEGDRGALDARSVRELLEHRLPAHARPDRVIVLNRFPVTDNGKVDERRLVGMLRSRPAELGSSTPANGELERELCAIWEAALGLDGIGVDDDFRALGGSSLLAMSVARAVRERTGRPLGAAAVLAAGTVRALATEVAAAAPSARADAGGGAVAPASPMQAGLWTLAAADPANVGFYEPVAIALRGPDAALRAQGAFAALVRRHEALRTHFELRGAELFAVICEHADPAPLEIAEAHGRPWSEATGDLLRAALADPPSLDRRPWRGWLVRLGPDEHVLLLLVHHIVFDGWSVGVLLEDLRATLDGEQPQPAPSATAVDRAEAAVAATTRERDAAYWRERFAQPPAPVALQPDRPRGTERSSRGGRRHGHLPASVAGGLDRLATAAGTTRFAVLTALLGELVRRYTASEDVVVCAPVARRDVPGAERTIGYLVNLVALRIDLSGDPSLAELVARAGRELDAARTHAGMAFEDVARDVAPMRAAASSTLARLVLVDDVQPATPVAAGDLVLDLLPVAVPTSKYELTVFVRTDRAGAALVWEYSAGLFDAETVDGLARGFEQLCASAAAAPAGALLDDLEILTGEDRLAIDAMNTTGSAAPPDRGLDALFDAWVRATPDAIAVEGPEEALTYAQLHERARRLGAALARAGVRPGDGVMIELERSVEQIVAVVAAIGLGAYYVPIDDKLPEARKSAMRAATGARVIVSRSAPPGEGVVTVDPGAEAQPGPPPPARAPGDVAYAMFTSGSTGTPKGVLVPDRAVVRLVREQSFMTVTPADVLMTVSNFSFDASTLEIWGALLNGARLVAVADDVVRDPRLLAGELERHRVTVGFFNVSMFRRLVDAGVERLRSFHTLLVGGEAVPEPLLRDVVRTLDPSVLVNGYGPTENTTFSCCHRLAAAPAPGTAIPIGAPIANSRAYVVDRRLRPVPVGATGEIVVGGAGLAHGYVNDATRTAQRFVPDTITGAQGARLYRTGDVGRMLRSGVIEYLGRTDDQVKVRGFRVQLGEIEHLLERQAGVDRAVVLAPETEHGRTLLGFVETRSAAPEELRRALGRIAPDWSVPSQIVVVDRFPETANRKVDRAALLALRRAPAPPSAAAQPPRSETELRLAAIWGALLDVAQVGRDDAFFEAGGDSLLIVVLRDRIAAAFGVALPIRALLEHPTVATQAQLLGGDAPPDGVHDRAAQRAARRRRATPRTVRGGRR